MTYVQTCKWTCRGVTSWEYASTWTVLPHPTPPHPKEHIKKCLKRSDGFQPVGSNIINCHLFPIICSQLSSLVINYIQASIVNYHQLSSIIINYHQLSSIIHYSRISSTICIFPFAKPYPLDLDPWRGGCDASLPGGSLGGTDSASSKTRVTVTVWK